VTGVEGSKAAGDGRTFVLGTSPNLRRGDVLNQPRPVTLYRLVLGRSGHPGRLAPLPIPTETGITGLALSRDGSKLAVSFLPAPIGGALIRLPAW
jgi:hypothetical protein